MPCDLISPPTAAATGAAAMLPPIGTVSRAGGPGKFEIVAAQSRGSSLVSVFTVNPGSGVNSSPIRKFQPFRPRVSALRS